LEAGRAHVTSTGYYVGMNTKTCIAGCIAAAALLAAGCDSEPPAPRVSGDAVPGNRYIDSVNEARAARDLVDQRQLEQQRQLDQLRRDGR
jgi:hypothetical protein